MIKQQTPKVGKADLITTQKAITSIKEHFKNQLESKLNLINVTAPLFVSQSSGLNDNLSGIEKPVCFKPKSIEKNLEIVQSLAKWKRQALAQFGFAVGEGLYTNMNAIRKDEEVDNTHSFYVDQWDWELVINKKQRKKQFLQQVVSKIYSALKSTQQMVVKNYGTFNNILPQKIYFITSQELENKYCHLTAKEREQAICKEKGAVFLMQIGHKLQSGERHDFRAPDYDDWQLNGDILVWNERLKDALELSSMGIRVSEQSIVNQCVLNQVTHKLVLPYHQAVLNKSLPYTIGGGIGQSRFCMFLLGKKHIGEVQSSIWPKSVVKECLNQGIKLIM